MKPPKDDRLIAELRALRPVPRPGFAAELDQRAAAGFPRRSRLPWPSFNRPQAIPQRGLFLSASAIAIAAIAVATALVLASENEPPRNIVAQGVEHPKPHQNFNGSASFSSPGKGGRRYSEEASETQSSTVAPVLPSETANAELKPFSQPVRHRNVERSAEVILRADTADVAEDSAKVFEAVHANNGIVMRSSTRQGKAGEAGASFDLLIPSAKLPDALAAFSAIDAVSSRHEATADITAPTVSVAELLRESRARIDGLLGQLEQAESDSEREAIETELRHERRHASRLAAQLDHLHRRANLSRVSVNIVTGDSNESSSGGHWGINDAFQDAGHILSTAGAVTVVGLAIIGPLALVAFIAWLARSTWVRRERRRALG